MERQIPLSEWFKSYGTKAYALAHPANCRIQFVIRGSDKRVLKAIRADGTGQRWEELRPEILARLMLVSEGNNLQNMYTDMLVNNNK
jgi:hypothetical protein